MEIDPYSIYYERRPLRIVFLVDPSKDQTWFDVIFEYNRGKWGGRFNPIIFSDGKTIEKEWWQFLRGYDPDIIYSTITLDRDFQKRINAFLTPLHVTIHSTDVEVLIHDDPVSILPTKDVISTLERGIFHEDASIVLFDIAKETPNVIKSFLSRNFGIIENNQFTLFAIKKALEACKTKTYPISDLTSLNDALLSLGDFQNRIVFPQQICSLPNSLKDVEHNYKNEQFTVVIGDSANDLAYHWNRTICIPQWMRTGITQLWIPMELSNASQLHTGLVKFFNRYISQTGNDSGRGLNVVSFSAEKSYLEAFANSFNNEVWHPKISEVLTEPMIPQFSLSHQFFFRKQGLDFFRGHSSEEHLVLREPDVEEGVMGGQYWVADLAIQFHPERFANIQGQEYWWRLPKRNGIISNNRMFNRPARINELGTFSLLMRRKSDFFKEENIVHFRLPKDEDIFYSLTCGEDYDCFASGPRDRPLNRPFDHMRRSDKGKYLSGVISLFPDIYNAQHYFEQRFWRVVFGAMANDNTKKNSRILDEIYRELKEKIVSGVDFRASDERVKWLANKVLGYAQRYSKENIDLPLGSILKMAQDEIEEYKKAKTGNQATLDEEELKDSISTLVEYQVFLVGARPKCPYCNYRIWYHVDVLRQNIKCEGCGYEFTINAEEIWYYRLNSLVRAAVSLHGTVPVLLVVAQIMQDARSSFLFMPSIELFKKYPRTEGEKPKPDAEVDFLCIKDGEFVIGEVKQSIDGFELKDFDRMLNLARLIRPNKILFSAMCQAPNKVVLDGIKRLQSELADLEIDVYWYPVNSWALDPSPIF